MNNPIVTIEMENGKKITAELYPDIAPQSVRNFISLANSGFYNGLIFHRCIYGFMIQGGCPDGTGMGGPGYCIKGEFAANGVPNDLRHTRGVLSMARAQDMDSAGSQFFIMHKDAPHLDGQYAAFGCVMDGMDVVDRIANQPRNMMTNKPKKPQVMKSVTVDTQGVTYPEPEKLAPAASAVAGSRHHSSSAARKPARADEIFFRMAWSLILSWVVWYPGPAGTPEAGPYR